MSIENNKGIPDGAEDFKFPENDEVSSNELSDEQIEQEINLESNDQSDLVEDSEDIEVLEEEAIVAELTNEEISAVETEMSENGFNINEYVKSIDSGFSEFSEHIVSTEDDKEKAREFTEKMKQFIGGLYGDFKTKLRDIDKLYKEKKNEEAHDQAFQFIDEAKSKASEYFDKKVDDWFKEYDSISDQADNEKDQSKKDKLKKVALEAIDFIPFIGDVKMIGEGVVGRTAQGEKLKGFKRFMHTSEGVVFLVANAISSGTGGTVLKSMKGAKIFTRSAAAMRKLGMSRKIYKPIFKAGKFIARHPMVGKFVDKGFKYVQRRRKLRQVQAIKKGSDVVFSETEETEEIAKKAA